MARGKTRAQVQAAASEPRPITFEPDGWTLDRFLLDNSDAAIIQGPIGSGKTRAAIMRMLRHCSEQPRQRDGKRRSRWIVVRQTYPELKSTTINAFLETFPDGEYGTMNWSPPFTYYFDHGDIEAEFIFLALEKEEDVKKVRSLEVTGAYVNELQYVVLPIFGEIKSRTGRYPSVKDGGCTWAGVIADMNAPEALHWVPIMFGQTPVPDYFTPDDVRTHKLPPGWVLFKQPPALIEEMGDSGEVIDYKVNPAAENLKWLRDSGDYYAKQIHGKTKAWIDANLLNRAAAVMKGRAVHPLFSADRHVSRTPLKFNPDLDLYGGFDFGLTPAAVFGQTVRGRVFVLFEMYAEDIGSITFAPMVRRELATRFPGLDFERVKLFGDPGGDVRGQADELTAFQIFRRNGLMIQKAPGANRFAGLHGRKETVDTILNRQVDGYQGLLLDPGCRMLASGLQGGYQFKDVQSPTGVYKSDQVIKNQYSHICFVAGTPVLTPKGEVAIEALQVGDLVRTPQGARRVSAIMSRDAPRLVRVTFSNGRSVVCTPEHPFATRHCGFVASEALQYGDVLVSEGQPWADPRYTRSTSSTECGTTESRQGTTRPTTSSAARTFTGLCGRIITAPFRRIITFITSTTIPPTTRSKTSSFSPRMSTRFSIFGWTADSRITRTRSGWPKSAASRPWLGEPPRCEQKCPQPQSSEPSEQSEKSASASCAPGSIPGRSTSESAGTAECRARASRAGPLALMTLIGRAFAAAPAFGRTSTQRKRPALKVARVELLPQGDTPTRVYDIEVETEHVFYAAGALVSNCEAFQYLTLGMGEGQNLFFGEQRARPVNVKSTARIFDRGPRRLEFSRAQR